MSSSWSTNKKNRVSASKVTSTLVAMLLVKEPREVQKHDDVTLSEICEKSQNKMK